MDFALQGMPIKKKKIIGRVRFLKRLEPFMTPRELEVIETAYVLAKYGHRAKFRDDGITRYFEHPKAVSLILIDELDERNWQTIVLGLLHDVPEDSFILSWNRIQINFGREIMKDLKLLTKKPKQGYEARLKKYANARTLKVKLADRLHNLRTLQSCKKEKQIRKIKETREHYIPLADLLIVKLPKKQKWQGEYLLKQIIKICKKFEKAF